MIAIKFHDGTEGPSEWPALVARELSQAPAWSERTFATDAELSAYLESVRPANDAWLANLAAQLATYETEQQQAKAVVSDLLAGTGTVAVRLARCERALAYIIKTVLR